MIAKLLQRLKGELALALMRTFVARGVAAVGGIVLFIVLGRLYGADGVGVFAIAQSIYLGAGILARYGMDNALMRYVGQDPTASSVPVYLRWALIKSTFLSIASAVLVFLLRGQFALWFNAPMLVEILPGIALAIPPFTVSFVLAGFMKGIRKPASACLLENGGIALVATLLVLVFDRISTAGIAMTGWSMAAAACLVLAQGLWQVRSYIKSKHAGVGVNSVDPGAFNSSSNTFFVMSMAGFMQNVVGIIIAGSLLSSSELGLFKVAERTAALIGFTLLVLNSVLPPRFSSLYQSREITSLEKLAKIGILLGLILSAPLLLVFFIIPEYVLSLYGEAFVNASLILCIIAVSQAVNVATGPASQLLNMTGNEQLMKKIALCTNAVGLLLYLILIPFFGGIGAALALSFVLVFENLITLFYVRRILGILR
ncbi:MAG: MATE family efflux transporter [Verrucomicrobiota bacterium]|nr:MATE family efflux transporter [Verrucomicrobiota bacterium]